MFVYAVYPFFALYPNAEVNVGFYRFPPVIPLLKTAIFRSYCEIFLLFLSQKPLTRSRQDFNLSFLSKKPPGNKYLRFQVVVK